MVTLYLARHGQTEENVAHILQGIMPGRLTELGKAQARELRDNLRDVRADVIICSDLQRAVDTAIIVNELHEVPLHMTSLLRERDWGDWTGLIIDELDMNQLPENAETGDALYQRAADIVQYLLKYYEGKVVIAIGHGLFCRFIQASLRNVQVCEIKPMANAEVRIIEISEPINPIKATEETHATAH